MTSSLTWGEFSLPNSANSAMIRAVRYFWAIFALFLPFLCGAASSSLSSVSRVSTEAKDVRARHQVMTSRREVASWLKWSDSRTHLNRAPGVFVGDICWPPFRESNQSGKPVTVVDKSVEDIRGADASAKAWFSIKRRLLGPGNSFSKRLSIPMKIETKGLLNHFSNCQYAEHFFLFLKSTCIVRSVFLRFVLNLLQNSPKILK